MVKVIPRRKFRLNTSPKFLVPVTTGFIGRAQCGGDTLCYSTWDDDKNCAYLYDIIEHSRNKWFCGTGGRDDFCFGGAKWPVDAADFHGGGATRGKPNLASRRRDGQEW